MKISQLIAVMALAGVGSSVAQAADGTWGTTTSGLAWSTSANWSSGIVADGSGFNANFGTLNPTANITVNLDSARTIGSLTFGDSDTSTAASWTLANSSNPANILTLAGTTPTITVNALGTNAIVTISAVLAGANGLVKDGTGTTTTGILALSGANTYSGGTTITTGTIRAQNSSALGTGAVTVANGARLQLSGGITLVNTINLNGSSALYGNLGANILSGTVNLQSNSSLIMNATNDNNLDLTGTVNLGTNTLTVSTVGNTNSFVNISGTINGSGGISKVGAGTLTIVNDQTATFSGATSLTGGGLAFGSDGALGTGTLTFGVNDSTISLRSSSTTARTLGNALVLAGNTGTLYTFGSTSSTVNGNLTFSNTGNIAMNSTSRKFVVNNRTQFNGAFTGTGGITQQTGTGTLVLNGVNTYTGATAVNAGTLLVNGSLAAGSAVTVASGAAVGGSGTINGTLAVNGTLAPGDGLGTLTVANDVTWNGTTGQDWKFELGTSSGSNDQLLLTGAGNDFLKGTGTDFRFDFLSTGVAGTFTLADWASTTTFSASDFTYTGLASGYSGTFALNGSQLDFTVAAVPEPSTYALLAVGGLVLVVLRRKGAKQI